MRIMNPLAQSSATDTDRGRRPSALRVPGATSLLGPAYQGRLA
jgi:hypothetical protein